MFKATQLHTKSGKYISAIPDNCNYTLKTAQDDVNCSNDPQDQLHESFIFLPKKGAENLSSIPFVFLSDESPSRTLKAVRDLTVLITYVIS